MSAKDLIAEARRLDATATKGPWRRCGAGDNCQCGLIWAEESHVVASVPCVRDEDGMGGPVAPEPWRFGNWQFATEARTLLPALADELEAALAHEASLRATNETLADDFDRHFRELTAEREAHAATKARLAPLDDLSEGEREAMTMWLQIAMQQGPAMVRRGAAALLQIVRADIA